MTELIDGVLKYNELTQNANGGTELMARRMARDLDPALMEGFQIIHSRVREFEPNKKRILVCHDLANDPEVAELANPEYRKNFEKIVFVSHWQQHTYNMVLGVPFSESVVIPNGVEVGEYKEKDFTGPIRLIYHTTPHRGLEILTYAFEELSKHFDVELDVFSSFKAYGWDLRDEQYKHVFDKLRSMENVRYHGFQPNEVIREALKDTHIFAYPSIWPETSCIALIEALVEGNFAVHSNLGALPETSRGLTTTYMFNEMAGAHLNEFYSRLYAMVKGIKNLDNPTANMYASNLANLAKKQYDWSNIKEQWNHLLANLKAK